MNPTKNLIEAKLYMNPTKNLIEPKPFMNPTKNLRDPKLYIIQVLRFLVGFMQSLSSISMLVGFI
jgi:hypothetical protein